MLNTNFGAYVNNDGAYPFAGLALNGSTLYGTTGYGGNFGRGTLFILNTDGSGFTVLKHFPGSFASGGISGVNNDGISPIGGVIYRDNMLYGTTEGGGTNGWGTIFKISIFGDGFTVLKDFSGNPDGAVPESPLNLSGNTLYGTTIYGGTGNNGTIFSINLDGTGYSTLKSFQPNVSGTNYDGGLNYVATARLSLNGSAFFSTTPIGGAFGSGTIFSLTMPTPALQIANSANIPIVFWIDDGLNHTLQIETNFTSNWTDIPYLNWTNNLGNQHSIGYQVLDFSDNLTAFFRLR